MTTLAVTSATSLLCQASTLSFVKISRTGKSFSSAWRVNPWMRCFGPRFIQARGLARDKTKRQEQFWIGGRESCSDRRSFRRLGRDGIAVVQAAESSARVNLGSDRRTYRCWPTCRCILCASEVRSILVVVAHVRSHQPLQMPLVQDDHGIQQVASAASHPTLGDPVLPRTAESSAHWLTSQVFRGRDYIIAKFCVAVEYQEPMRRHIRPRFSHLLHDPESIRISRDVET